MKKGKKDLMVVIAGQMNGKVKWLQGDMVKRQWERERERSDRQSIDSA